jgi:hypothetical protein
MLVRLKKPLPQLIIIKHYFSRTNKEMNIPWYRKLLYILLAPFIVGVFCIMNPRKVWAQAKKEFGVE